MSFCFKPSGANTIHVYMRHVSDKNANIYFTFPIIIWTYHNDDFGPYHINGQQCHCVLQSFPGSLLDTCNEFGLVARTCIGSYATERSLLALDHMAQGDHYCLCTICHREMIIGSVPCGTGRSLLALCHMTQGGRPLILACLSIKYSVSHMPLNVNVHNAKHQQHNGQLWLIQTKKQNKISAYLQKIFSNMFLDKNAISFFNISLNFGPNSQINNKPGLVWGLALQVKLTYGQLAQVMVFC